MDLADIQQLRTEAAAIAPEVLRNCRRYRLAAYFFVFVAISQLGMTVLAFRTAGWRAVLLGAFTVAVAFFLFTTARRRVRQWRRLLFHLQRVVACDPRLAWHWESARLVLEELKQ